MNTRQMVENKKLEIAKKAKEAEEIRKSERELKMQIEAEVLDEALTNALGTEFINAADLRIQTYESGESWQCYGQFFYGNLEIIITKDNLGFHTAVKDGEKTLLSSHLSKANMLDDLLSAIAQAELKVESAEQRDRQLKELADKIKALAAEQHPWRWPKGARAKYTVIRYAEPDGSIQEAYTYPIYFSGDSYYELYFSEYPDKLTKRYVWLTSRNHVVIESCEAFSVEDLPYALKKAIYVTLDPALLAEYSRFYNPNADTVHAGYEPHDFIKQLLGFHQAAAELGRTRTMEHILTERVTNARQLGIGHVFYLIDRSNDKERLYPVLGEINEIYKGEDRWGFEFKDLGLGGHCRKFSYKTMDEWMKGGVQVYRVFGFDPDKDDPKEVMDYIHKKTLPNHMDTCRECDNDFEMFELTIDGYCYDCSYGERED